MHEVHYKTQFVSDPVIDRQPVQLLQCRSYVVTRSEWLRASPSSSHLARMFLFMFYLSAIGDVLKNVSVSQFKVSVSSWSRPSQCCLLSLAKDLEIFRFEYDSKQYYFILMRRRNFWLRKSVSIRDILGMYLHSTDFFEGQIKSRP